MRDWIDLSGLNNSRTYHRPGHRHQCLCCSFKFKGFELENRLCLCQSWLFIKPSHCMRRKDWKSAWQALTEIFKAKYTWHFFYYYYYLSRAIAYLMLKSLVSFLVHGRVMDQGRALQWTSATATPSRTPTWAPSRMGSNTSTRLWESTEWPQQQRTA